MLLYKIYFVVYNGNEGFSLAVMPEEIKINSELDVNNETLVNGTNITTSSVVSLRTIEFETIFYAENKPDPQFHVNLLRKWQINKTPVRFIYVADSRDINMLVFIESFEHREIGGVIGDIYCSISLIEYKPPAVRVLSISSDQTTYKQQSSQRTDNRTIPASYTFIRGDSLWKVAKKFYDNGNRYKDIQKLNNIPDSKLTSLPIGLVVKLP